MVPTGFVAVNRSGLLNTTDDSDYTPVVTQLREEKDQVVGAGGVPAHTDARETLYMAYDNQPGTYVDLGRSRGGG